MCLGVTMLVSPRRPLSKKMLWRKERRTRHDLGRERFSERALEWKDEYHGKINKVLRRLGGSFDWSREAFTWIQSSLKL